ncbi:hypothetical protein [Burkholderia cenocepacia]|nr:hypothetical protein [Burkholderia cenocepacia]
MTSLKLGLTEARRAVRSGLVLPSGRGPSGWLAVRPGGATRYFH